MLLILGLDGATLDLVEPWVAAGMLPNLAHLMREGAWGRLASTVPPATFPSWTTFMTGVNPGRHGVFDFTRREPGAYRVRFVNATHRKAPSIWRLLSEAGRRVSVLGLPGTYPPEPINGLMVSGFDTPVTTQADESFVYPPSFAGVVRECGGFPFAGFQEFRIGRGWHARALASLLEGIERKASLVERLLARERWDCLMLLLGESDTAAHHFWCFHDPASPRFDAAGAEALGNPIRKVYVALDELIGRLVTQIPEAQVLLVSDHGFGGAGRSAIHLNRWLAQERRLAWAPRTAIARWAGGLRSVAVRGVPEGWQARCFRLADGSLASAVESGVRFGGIDWQRTQAFSEELNYFPAIWLNVEGREPMGAVPQKDYRCVCAELTELLLAWEDSIRQTRVVRHVWHRDDLYHGPCLEMAPDLVLDLATPDGYSYVCLPSYGTLGPAIEQIAPEHLRGGKLSGMSGSHRSDGLFILAGNGITRGEVSGADMTAMAPTILALCGVPVPADWDGSALPCLGAPSSTVLSSSAVGLPGESEYDAAQEACLRQRLEDLGYLA